MANLPEEADRPASVPAGAHIALIGLRGRWRGTPVLDGLLAALLIWLIVAAANHGFRDSAHAEFRSQMIDGLRRVGRTSASLLDLAVLARIREPEQTNDPVFESLARPLRAVRDGAADVKYIYTCKVVGREPDLQVVFQVDCSEPGDHDGDGREDQARVGEQYVDAPPELLDAWRTGEERHTEQPYSDEWGTFMSLFLPVVDGHGEVVSVIGVDMDVATYEARMAAVVRAADSGLVIAMVAGLCVGFCVTMLRRSGQRSLRMRQAAQAELREAKERAEQASLQKSSFIDELVRGRQRLLAVANAVSENSGQDFLGRLTAAMAVSLGADFAMIAEVVEGRHGRLRSLTNWYEGACLLRFEYDTDGTPCAQSLAANEPFVVPFGVLEHYPEDRMFADWRLDAYAGCAVRDADGVAIGLIVVASRQPFVDAEAVKSLLRIYATRAGAELERLRHEGELRSAKELAEIANHSKTEFLTNMSHEIRTPMTAILGFADLIAEDVETGASRSAWQEHLRTIQANGRALLTILDDLLDLSKIEAGKMRIESLPVPWAAVVREVCDLLRPRAAGRGVELLVDIGDPRMPLLQTDPVRLRQILMNLVGNAVKFTERGWVRVMVYKEERVGEEGEWLVFEVEDTGIGMNEEQLSRLFRPFEQADTSVTRRFGGTGLGLRICRRLARLLGGRIDVASTLDEGSTFVLRLPALAATMPDFLDPRLLGVHAQSTEGARPGNADLDGVRVLVVDDGADNRRLLSAVLERAGAEVVAVAGATDAYARLQSRAAFDVVLMDMQMPDIDGLTAVRDLREQGSSIPVIAVTANAMSEERERCLAAGCAGFASKPIDRRELVAMIDRLVAQGPRNSGSHDE